jgi:hypothetical protein
MISFHTCSFFYAILSDDCARSPAKRSTLAPSATTAMRWSANAARAGPCCAATRKAPASTSTARSWRGSMRAAQAARTEFCELYIWGVIILAPAALTRSAPRSGQATGPSGKTVFLHEPTWLASATPRRSHYMPFADPLWLTALAALVASLASLIWAVRRKR